MSCSKQEKKKKKASVKAQETKKRKIQEHNENVAKGWAMEDEVLLREKESKLKELEQSHKSISKGGKGKKALSNTMTRLKTDIRRLKSKYQLNNHVDVVEPKPIQVPLRTKRVKVTTKKGCESSMETIRKWTGTTRWTYNQCVAYGREHPEIELMSDVDMLRTLRDHVASLKGANPWIEETPYDVRGHGITDYKKAVRSNQAKRKKIKATKGEGTTFSFKIGFRVKGEAVNETITIDSKHWNKGQYKFLVENFKSKELDSILEIVPCAVNITTTRMGCCEVYVN